MLLAYGWLSKSVDTLVAANGATTRVSCRQGDSGVFFAGCNSRQQAFYVRRCDGNKEDFQVAMRNHGVVDLRHSRRVRGADYGEYTIVGIVLPANLVLRSAPANFAGEAQ